MAKIYLDPGHGGTDTGATGQGLQEKDIVLKIANYTRDYLRNNNNNIQVRMSRTSDKTVSLTERTNDANSWGADLFVSVHINAFNGSANGYEDYIYNRLSNNSEARKLQDAIHNDVSSLFRTSRGKKKANFHVLRESAMPAVLTENGFIDNQVDAELLKSESNLQRIGEAHAKGIAAYLGLSAGFSQSSSPSSSSSNKGVKWIGTNEKGKRVESIYRGSEGLRFYDGPRWTNPSGTFGYKEGWIVDNKYMVDGYPQYRVQNSKGDLYYITAAPQYVRVVGGAAGKSINQMATEVIRGNHGDGHETRRGSLGISQAQYENVRAEVNRRM